MPQNNIKTLLNSFGENSNFFENFALVPPVVSVTNFLDGLRVQAITFFKLVIHITCLYSFDSPYSADYNSHIPFSRIPFQKKSYGPSKLKMKFFEKTQNSENLIKSPQIWPEKCVLCAESCFSTHFTIKMC
jgi:hypothetical protein